MELNKPMATIDHIETIPVEYKAIESSTTLITAKINNVWCGNPFQILKATKLSTKNPANGNTFTNGYTKPLSI